MLAKILLVPTKGKVIFVALSNFFLYIALSKVIAMNLLFTFLAHIYCNCKVQSETIIWEQ